MLSSARTFNRWEKKHGLNLIPQLYNGAPAAISKVFRLLSFRQNRRQNDTQGHFIETREWRLDNNQLAAVRDIHSMFFSNENGQSV
jgi:hypothetical protein